LELKSLKHAPFDQISKNGENRGSFPIKR
jgi:hypothetical protein